MSKTRGEQGVFKRRRARTEKVDQHFAAAPARAARAPLRAGETVVTLNPGGTWSMGTTTSFQSTCALISGAKSSRSTASMCGIGVFRVGGVAIGVTLSFGATVSVAESFSGFEDAARTLCRTRARYVLSTGG